MSASASDPESSGAIAWFHCFSGIAGDMALGALVDAGADLDEIRAIVGRLAIRGWAIEPEPVLRGGIAATRIHVHVQSDTIVRTASHITGMVEEAQLPQPVERRALATFHALAEVEGRLHRRPPEQVHFHEVGGLDAIVDVVGTCAALHVLGIDDVRASAVATGTGMVRTAHGLLPNPVPAVVDLLRDAPTYGLDLPVELVTPTGAALLAASATGWGPLPAMRITGGGFGAGEREIEARPNVVQVVLGASIRAPADVPSGATTLPSDLSAASPDHAMFVRPGQPVVLLEANLDDATGEVLAHAIQALLDAGAHDAWVTPLVMKKGRPAHMVSALADPSLAEPVAAILALETGTLGLRGITLERWPLARQPDVVEVDGVAVRVKVSTGRIKVEHDDAVRAARELHRPLREVLSQAEEAARRLWAETQQP